MAYVTLLDVQPIVNGLWVKVGRTMLVPAGTLAIVWIGKTQNLGWSGKGYVVTLDSSGIATLNSDILELDTDYYVGVSESRLTPIVDIRGPYKVSEHGVFDIDITNITSNSSHIKFKSTFTREKSVSITVAEVPTGSVKYRNTINVNSGGIFNQTITGLSPDTTYILQVSTWASNKFYTKTVAWRTANGEGEGGGVVDTNEDGSGTIPSQNRGDVGVYSDGTPGYPTVTDNIGPYPIDDNTYTGQQGTQRGVTWKATSSYGYFWAKISGTGHKLIDNDITHRYTGTYDPNHHGTGDYAYIDLEGDCGFSNCSWCQWTVSALMTTDSNWGTWDPGPSGLVKSTWNDWWYPGIHWFGSGRSWTTVDTGVDLPNGLLKRLNPWRDSNYKYYNAGPNSGLYNDHASWGGGRGSVATQPIERELTSKVVSYYCLQNMNDSGYDGSTWGARRGYGSVAAIQFIVPRLDPLIKVISSNPTYGSAYFQIATGYNSDTEEYTYDSTHYTERYIPIGTHIKVVAVKTDTGKFTGFSLGEETLTEEEIYEVDINDNFVGSEEEIVITANFEAGQFEIKVSKNEYMASATKSPTHGQDMEEDWYNVNEIITFTAEVLPEDDLYRYKFEGWFIGNDLISEDLIFTATTGVDINKSCTIEARGSKEDLGKYYIVYNPWECDGVIINETTGRPYVEVKPGLRYVLAKVEDHLKLIGNPNSNYRFIRGDGYKWERTTKLENDWEGCSSTQTAGQYHYFRPILEVDGATCDILAPDDGSLRVIAQPIIIKREDSGMSHFTEVNTRFIGADDPNGLEMAGKIPIIKAELGDFFFMLKGGE